MPIIPDMIRQARESAGLTRAEAARLLDVDWRRLWEWEEGRRAPRNLDAILRKLQRQQRRGK